MSCLALNLMSMALWPVFISSIQRIQSFGASSSSDEEEDEEEDEDEDRERDRDLAFAFAAGGGDRDRRWVGDFDRRFLGEDADAAAAFSFCFCSFCLLAISFSIVAFFAFTSAKCLASNAGSVPHAPAKIQPRGVKMINRASQQTHSGKRERASVSPVLVRKLTTAFDSVSSE